MDSVFNPVHKICVYTRESSTNIIFPFRVIQKHKCFITESLSLLCFFQVPILRQIFFSNHYAKNSSTLQELCECTCLKTLMCPKSDMPFVTTFTWMIFKNNCLPQKRVNYDKLCFPTKEQKVSFYIINIHTQGYITLNKYVALSDPDSMKFQL